MPLHNMMGCTRFHIGLISLIFRNTSLSKQTAMLIKTHVIGIPSDYVYAVGASNCVSWDSSSNLSHALSRPFQYLSIVHVLGITDITRVG